MQKSFLSPLDAAEEADYLERLSRGDLQAREVLIERNMRLVAHIAKKYLSPEEDMEDLISIGTIGLIKAVSTFRPERSIRLGTYAARCIEKATPPVWLHIAIKTKIRPFFRIHGKYGKNLIICAFYIALKIKLMFMQSYIFILSYFNYHFGALLQNAITFFIPVPIN